MMPQQTGMPQQQMQQQQQQQYAQQPQQYQPNPPRSDKSSILALYNYPQLAPQRPLQSLPEDSVPGGIQQLPQQQQMQAPQRSVTMPLSSGNMNPFQQQTQQAPGFNGNVNGTRHVSHESKDFQGFAGSGRHSPDAFAGLSARYVRWWFVWNGMACIREKGRQKACMWCIQWREGQARPREKGIMYDGWLGALFMFSSRMVWFFYSSYLDGFTLWHFMFDSDFYISWEHKACGIWDIWCERKSGSIYGLLITYLLLHLRTSSSWICVMQYGFDRTVPIHDAWVSLWKPHEDFMLHALSVGTWKASLAAILARQAGLPVTREAS
jgi:hypothetical protein